jgi:hypothetical protein
MPCTKRSTNDSPAAPAVGLADGQSISPDGELPADLELPKCDGSVAVLKQLGRNCGTRWSPTDDQGGGKREAPSVGHLELCEASDHQCGERGSRFQDSEPQVQCPGGGEHRFARNPSAVSSRQSSTHTILTHIPGNSY